MRFKIIVFVGVSVQEGLDRKCSHFDKNVLFLVTSQSPKIIFFKTDVDCGKP